MSTKPFEQLELEEQEIQYEKMKVEIASLKRSNLYMSLLRHIILRKKI